MTISDFKLRVAAIVNRSASLFVVGGVDNLLQAMNDARRAAQREYSFHLLKRDVFLTVTPGGANWQTGCKTTPDGATAALLKRVDALWMYAEQAYPGGTSYLRTQLMDSGVTGDFKRSLPTYDTGQLIITNQPSWTTRRSFWYTQGSNLFVTNLTTSTTYLVEGVQWLDDLTGSESPDIFLTYFTDWFAYATVAALNNYVKDNERFPLDAAIMARLWESVKQMDGELANSGDWTNLD